MPVIRKSLPWAGGGAGAGVAAAALLVCSAVPAHAVPRVVAPSTAPAAWAGTTAMPAQSGSSIATTPASRTPFVARTTQPAAKSVKGGYKYFDSDFILRLRGSAIEPEADIPHPLVPGVGYSAVNLEKDIGGPYANCEVFGAGAYLTDIVQEGILENSGPPDAGNKGGGIFNPTEAKDFAPNLSPGANLNARTPSIRDVGDGHTITTLPHDGNGVRWQAHCDNDASGTGTGYNTDIAGVQSLGSTTTAHVDKVTGEYVGASRAFIAGLDTGSGTIDLISSVVSIKHLPGQKPTVSFRIGATGGTSAAASNVPWGDLTKAFNDAVKSQAGATSAIGPTGGLLQLMGPTESESENGGRYIINFPFFELQQGLEARKGTAGHNQRVRLVNIDYEGLYQGGAIQEPKAGGFDS